MKLEGKELRLLQSELEAFLPYLDRAEARGKYERLFNALKTGAIPEDLVGEVERLLELGLETGRVRKVYGPHGEKVLLGLYTRTPKGSKLLALTEEANEALRTLRGQVIGELTFSLQGPGAYSLLIDTDRCRITVGIDREGLRVEGVEIGI